VFIVLRSTVNRPLKTKVRGVVLVSDKARNEILNDVGGTAPWFDQNPLFHPRSL